ncbi:hypothetical protein [Microtetraspora malaysiensis]|uniref:hypothetical protein n=1 Tax=Microtetraspora malaysiensis TaxID=161358 RepID=UPI003D9420B6
MAEALFRSIFAISVVTSPVNRSPGAGPSALTTPTHSPSIRSAKSRPPQCASRSRWFCTAQTAGPTTSSATADQ